MVDRPSKDIFENPPKIPQDLPTLYTHSDFKQNR